MHVNRLCILFLLRISSVVAQTIPYDTIVCFGDSLSDTGNVYNLSKSLWPPSPYYLGRFSNGPIWFDKLAIANRVNYAYGGATTDNQLVPGETAVGISVPGVRQQIALYKNRTNLTSVNFDRTIYAIWAGGNDYYYSNLTVNASAVVNSLINGVNDLIAIGAKDFVLINQSPLQAYPAIASRNISQFLNGTTILHNYLLSNQVNSLQSQNSQRSFYLYNVYALINNILNNQSAYGVNSTTNCWYTLNGTIVQLCSNPGSYLFIDEYHFTTRIHQYIADDLSKLLGKSHGLILTTLPIYLYILFTLQMFIIS